MRREAERVLVTGGRGFIGRSVCSALSAQGYDVVALDRAGGDDPARELPVSGVECDVRDAERVDEVFRRFSPAAVVHLASLLNTASRRNPLDATAVNIGGSLNLLEAARKFHAPRVVYGSSISVYGSRPGRDSVSETDPAAPEDVYGATKRYVEIVGETYRQRFEVEFVALRIASVIGRGAASTSSPWRSEIFEKLGRSASRAAEVSIPYRGEETLPLVHVDEVAGMIGRLVEAERVAFPVYNTPAESWRVIDLARLVGSLDGTLRIRFGEAEVRGIPRAIDGQRLVTEFEYIPLSLEERFRRAADSGNPAGDELANETQEKD